MTDEFEIEPEELETAAATAQKKSTRARAAPARFAPVEAKAGVKKSDGKEVKPEKGSGRGQKRGPRGRDPETGAPIKLEYAKRGKGADTVASAGA